MDIQPILKTERLVLRPFVADDATRVEELAGDKRIADVTASIPHPYPKGVAIGWILSHPLKMKKGEAFNFAITLTDTSKLIGCISIMNIRNKNGELGYWIGTEFWNNGYCTEACKCLVNYGFTKLNLNRVYAHHLSRNPASGKVLAKSGLIHIGSSKSECGYQKKIEKTELYEKFAAPSYSSKNEQLFRSWNEVAFPKPISGNRFGKSVSRNERSPCQLLLKGA